MSCRRPSPRGQAFSGDLVLATSSFRNVRLVESEIPFSLESAGRGAQGISHNPVMQGSGLAEACSWSEVSACRAFSLGPRICDVVSLVHLRSVIVRERRGDGRNNRDELRAGPPASRHQVHAQARAPDDLHGIHGQPFRAAQRIRRSRTGDRGARAKCSPGDEPGCLPRRAAPPSRAERGPAAGGTPLPRTYRWTNRHWRPSHSVPTSTARPSAVGNRVSFPTVPAPGPG